MTAMILLGNLIIVLTLLASAAISSSGFGYLQARIDLPSGVFVFLGVLYHIVRWGRPYFFTGIKAVFVAPKVGDPVVAAYFRSLTRWTLGVGIAGMVYGGIIAVGLLRMPETIGYAMAVMLFTFSYAGWLALMLFWPIAVRFSVDSEPVPFPVTASALGLASFFLTRACMALMLVCLVSWDEQTPGLPHAEDIRLLFEQTLWKFNPGDTYGDFVNYFHPQMYWDTPSLLVIMLGLWAFRIAAGKPTSRMEWIPVSILFGVLWSIEGMTMMLCDLDPTKFGAGCMVALLTTFYGFVAAGFFAVGSWRLVAVFFLSLALIPYTVAAPHVVLMGPFYSTDGVLSEVLGMFVISFFLAYGGLLYVYFRTVLIGVRNLDRRFRKPPVDTDPMTPDEEEARKILDSAVVQSRSRKDQ